MSIGTIRVYEARTPAEREAAERLRYDVWVKEIGVTRFLNVDHEARRLADRFDASGRVLVAEIDGVAAGTIRLNVARDTDVSADFRSTYRISELETHIGQKWAYSSRLVISGDSRGGAVLQQLADAHFELALREEVECLVLNCTPALVHLYEKLGCRRYAAGFLDEEVGYRVPMLAPIRDAEFQRIGRTLIWGLLQRHQDKWRSPDEYRFIEETFGRTLRGEYQLEDEAFWGFLSQRISASDFEAIPLLEGMTAKERVDAIEHSTVLSVRCGDLVVRHGDASQEMYLVLSGTFDVIDAHRDRIAELGVGDAFGEIGWIASSRRTVDVHATSDGEVLVLTQPGLRRVIAKNPTVAAKFLFNLSRLICERLAYKRINDAGVTPRREAGSYDFATYRGQRDELARLDAQAAATWRSESALLTQCGLRAGICALDLGCGPGFLTRHLAKAIGPSGAVTGLDVSPALLATARTLVPDADAAPITFVEGSTYEIPFPDGAFDFVYARLLCQHLEQPDRAMGEIARVLAPGGSVMLVDSDDGVLSMTPEPEGFAELNRLAIELQRTRGGDREVGRKLGGLCRKAGLHGIEIKVQVFTTEQIPIEQFIAIALSFKVELFNIEDRPRAQSLLDSILAHVDARTFAMGGIYLVSAKRGR